MTGCWLQVNSCKRNMNTFAFVGDLEKSPEVSCVYHSEDAENQVRAYLLTQRCCLLTALHHSCSHVLGAARVPHRICQSSGGSAVCPDVVAGSHCTSRG